LFSVFFSSSSPAPLQHVRIITPVAYAPFFFFSLSRPAHVFLCPSRQKAAKQGSLQQKRPAAASSHNEHI
jgi:hypothetical protein